MLAYEFTLWIHLGVLFWLAFHWQLKNCRQMWDVMDRVLPRSWLWFCDLWRGRDLVGWGKLAILQSRSHCPRRSQSRSHCPRRSSYLFLLRAKDLLDGSPQEFQIISFYQQMGRQGGVDSPQGSPELTDEVRPPFSSWNLSEDPLPDCLTAAHSLDGGGAAALGRRSDHRTAADPLIKESRGFLVLVDVRVCFHPWLKQ